MDTKLIGREADCRQIESLIGQAGTGKSLTLRYITNSLERRSPPSFVAVHVNCVEACSSPRLLYDTILYRLAVKLMANFDDDTEENRASWLDGICKRCDTAGDFVNRLQDLLSVFQDKLLVNDKSSRSFTVCFVLDNAERLRDFHPNVLQVLLRLSDLISLKGDHRVLSFVSVLISQSPWEKFTTATFHQEPYLKHFQNYKQSEMQSILVGCAERIVPELRGVPSEHCEAIKSIYFFFVECLLNVCWYICRNASELIYLAQTNWKRFFSALKATSKDLSSVDNRTVWKRCQPFLRQSLEMLYLREVPALESVRSLAPATQENHQYSLASICLELPLFPKYLLIAAYIASYNPKSSDKKFFVKYSEKKTSRMKEKLKKQERTKNNLVGPKPFPLDRLMAIFYAMVDDNNIPHSVLLASQVASLLSLNLLAACGGGGDDALANPKYKCMVSLETVDRLAKSVEFDLRQHLTDYV